MEAIDMGNRIKKARSQKGLTQKELAAQIHVTDKAVSKWERGLCFPDISNMETLAQALEIKVTDLFMDSLPEKTAQDKTEQSLRDAVQIAKDRRRKQRRDIILAFAGMILFEALAVILIGYLLVSDFTVEKEKSSRIADYAAYMAVPDTRNDFAPSGNGEWIFPRSIPEGAKVNDFYYEYYNPWDPNYVIYLDMTFDEEAYEKEKTRLISMCGIPSAQEHYLVYGTDGFYYPLLSLTGQYRGILYALTDEETRRIMYVNISFCNFYCDIDYEEIIPADILPIGFDAKKHNPTRRKFDVTRDMESAFPDEGTELLPSLGIKR